MVQDLIDLHADGQVNAVAGGELYGGAGGGDAFDDLGRAGDDLGWCTAAADLLASPAIAAVAAGARRDDVPETSQASHRARIAARGLHEPTNFDQRTRDERRARVVAVAKPVSSAGRQRNDVLERAAQLDADQVSRRVDPKRRPVQQLLEHGGHRRVGARDDGRGRQASTDFFGVRRPRERRHRAAVAPQHLSHNLGEPVQRRELQPLGGVQHRHSRRNVRRHQPRHLAHGPRDRHQQHGAGARNDFFERRARLDPRRNTHAWQVDLVFARPRDVLGQRRAATPQADLVASVPQQH